MISADSLHTISKAPPLLTLINNGAVARPSNFVPETYEYTSLNVSIIGCCSCCRRCSPVSPSSRKKIRSTASFGTVHKPVFLFGSRYIISTCSSSSSFLLCFELFLISSFTINVRCAQGHVFPAKRYNFLPSE